MINLITSEIVDVYFRKNLSLNMKVVFFSIFYVLSTYVFFSQIIGSFLYTYLHFPIFVLKSLVIIKYVFSIFSFVLFVFICLNKNKVSFIDILLLLYLLSLLPFCFVLVIQNKIGSKFIYLYIFPVLLYITGRLMWYLKFQIQPFIKYLTTIGIISSLFGFIDYFYFKEFFWKNLLHYGLFIKKVKGLPGGIINGLPGNFYFDPYILKIRRFTGIFGDPLAHAYFIFIVLIILKDSNGIFKNKTLKNLIELCLLISLLLTLTRAIIITIIIIYILSKLQFNFKLNILITVSAIIMITILIFNINIIPFVDSSTIGHVMSIKTFFNDTNFQIFIYGEAFSNKDLIFEPALYNLLVFAGIIPFLIFICAYFMILKKLYKNNRSVFYIFLGGLLLMSLFSQSFLSFTPSWPAWFLAGYFQKYSSVRRNNEHFTYF